jgi:hypothetical protein
VLTTVFQQETIEKHFNKHDPARHKRITRVLKTEMQLENCREENYKRMKNLRTRTDSRRRLDTILRRNNGGDISNISRNCC